MIKLANLGEVLAEPDSYLPALRLYISFVAPWTPASECMLSDEGDAEHPPMPAMERGMEYVMGIDAVQDAMANAIEQRAGLTNEERFDAFVHYYDNDAFILFSRG